VKFDVLSGLADVITYTRNGSRTQNGFFGATGEKTHAIHKKANGMINIVMRWLVILPRVTERHFLGAALRTLDRRHFMLRF
jgi:hypothetical protein